MSDGIGLDVVDAEDGKTYFEVYDDPSTLWGSEAYTRRKHIDNYLINFRQLTLDSRSWR